MNLEIIRENSYTNFHQKGVSYLCLQRNKFLTVKAYFFDSELVSDIVPLVAPHNHRYDFYTTVLRGSVRNITYEEIPSQKGDWIKYDYYSPLNHSQGNFIIHSKDRFLTKVADCKYLQNESYFQYDYEIHTIIPSNDCILLLTQHSDITHIDVPSITYSRVPLTLSDDLYEKMSYSEIGFRLDTLQKLGYTC